MSCITTPQELMMRDDVGSYLVKIGMTFTDRDGTVWKVQGWLSRPYWYPDVMVRNVSTGRLTDLCSDSVVWMLRDRPYESLHLSKGLGALSLDRTYEQEQSLEQSVFSLSL